MTPKKQRRRKLRRRSGPLKLLLKKLTGTEDLWEIRAQHAGDSFRLLGFFDGPKLVVLVSAFAKKSQQTPKQELVRAAERRRDYLSRRKADE